MSSASLQELEAAAAALHDPAARSAMAERDGRAERSRAFELLGEHRPRLLAAPERVEREGGSRSPPESRCRVAALVWRCSSPIRKRS